MMPRWTGVYPIAPTPFSDDGDVDIDGQRRVLDCMIDQGVDGICILANYSEQFLLSDRERDTLLDVCDNVLGRSFCALGDGAVSPITSGIRYFRQEFVDLCSSQSGGARGAEPPEGEVDRIVELSGASA